MFSIFFEGMMLGFGAAVPLGPINLLIMNEALKSYKKAVFIGLGAMSADITYLLFIIYGVTTFLKDQMLLNVLSILGGFFLIYFAYLIFQGRNQKIKKVNLLKEKSLISHYLKGYILTLLNPYTILFWLSVTTYSANTDSLILTILGLMSAILLWITLMPYLVYRQKHMISDNISSVIAIISSIVLLIFGMSMLFKVLV